MTLGVPHAAVGPKPSKWFWFRSLQGFTCAAHKWILDDLRDRLDCLEERLEERLEEVRALRLQAL